MNNIVLSEHMTCKSILRTQEVETDLPALLDPIPSGVQRRPRWTDDPNPSPRPPANITSASERERNTVHLNQQFSSTSFTYSCRGTQKRNLYVSYFHTVWYIGQFIISMSMIEKCRNKIFYDLCAIFHFLTRKSYALLWCFCKNILINHFGLK